MKWFILLCTAAALLGPPRPLGDAALADGGQTLPSADQLDRTVSVDKQQGMFDPLHAESDSQQEPPLHRIDAHPAPMPVAVYAGILLLGMLWARSIIRGRRRDHLATGYRRIS